MATAVGPKLTISKLKNVPGRVTMILRNLSAQHMNSDTSQWKMTKSNNQSKKFWHPINNWMWIEKYDLLLEVNSFPRDSQGNGS
jgi:hypothetical protein